MLAVRLSSPLAIIDEFAELAIVIWLKAPECMRPQLPTRPPLSPGRPAISRSMADRVAYIPGELVSDLGGLISCTSEETMALAGRRWVP